MSFSVPLSEKTPQTVWDEQEQLGGRLLLTIPFGSPEDQMDGFISVMGSHNKLPVISLCVAKPTGGSVLSTVVFPSVELYLGFVSSIQNDSLLNFFEGETF